jgi:Phage tail sheath protein subtilisin-like domain/Phage tail sheath C-terminal domain
MATFISPEVAVVETDLTITTPGVATSTGAFAGEFVWGPVNDVTQVANEADLVSRFGKPDNTTFASFFTAKNFLDYSNNLQLVRISTAGQLNAVSTGTAVKIGNEATYTSSYASGEASVGMFAAKYPGVLGNSLRVSLADAATYSRTLTGTVATAASSAVLTGTGTNFVDELTVGSYVTVGATTKQVIAIGSATSATVDSNYTSVQSGVTATAEWEYASLFDAAPIDSDRALEVGATGDGLHAVVVDEDGSFSGTPGTVLEIFDNISKASDAMRFDGTAGYYKTVLNGSSYVWWMDHPDTADLSATAGTAFGAAAVASTAYKNLLKPVSRSLTLGADGSAATDGETQLAFDLFKNVELIDVSLIFTGKVTADVSRYVIQSIAEYRKDAIAFVSPVGTAKAPIVGDTADSLEDIIAWNTSLNVNSSFGVADSGFKYQYDKYNDVYRWIPLNGDVAGLCARTDSVAAPWFSPAGLNRGQIKNVTRLAYNPDKAARDELFKRSINPVVSFPGEGTVLFGDKTTTRRPSAFDAINVRRLFILLEKSIAAASKYYLFEQNTDLTRQLFAGTINPLLRDVKGRQGITDFYVDVGPTVNTADTIDAGELRANIFIKPVRSVRFIRLNFIATRTSASFTEIQL